MKNPRTGQPVLQEEYVFAPEVAGSEALEPQSLKEVKARLDWPLWEKAIEEELEVLLVFGSPVRSGFLTPRAIDRDHNRSFYFRIPKKTGPN